MRRITLYLGLAAALVASCSTQEKDFQIPAQDDTVFYASFEQPADEGTKVYANEDLLLRWTADDRVSIFNKLTYNQQYKFTGETGDNAGGFRKVDTDEFVTGNAISHVVSVYPYQETTKITESEVLTVTLPTEQTYAQNTFGLGANTMVSVSSDNILQYKNVGGYLVFKLYGEGVSVSSITLKGNNGEKLAGKATVSMPLDGVPTAVMAENATTEITLTCPEPVALGATAEESAQFWFVVPPVTFSKGFTVAVNLSTGSVFEKSTSKSITIERNKLTKMSPMEVVTGPVPDAVDLGLSVKWASFNLGASSPEGYGDYFAWGEMEPKDDYSYATYKWCMGRQNTLTKYCYYSGSGYNGFTDSKTVLDLEDDAARSNWGSNWRLPTVAEWAELGENCTWTWTARNGVNGILVTSLNGNSIFLPAAGNRGLTNGGRVGSSGYYWSSSLYTGDPNFAWCVYFDSGGVDYRFCNNRFLGFSVRPVFGESAIIPVASVSLDKTQQELVVGKTATLVATVFPENATNNNVTWSSSNTSVATVSSNGNVTGVGAGTATITVTTLDGGKTATCTVTVTEPYTVATPEAVDLGLPSGLKWASFNLGASAPEGYGDYYAWGETEPYYISQDPLIWKTGKEAGYDWPSYKWCRGSQNTLTKYCSYSEYGYNGFTDTKTVLDPEDDAATVNLGASWRMPMDAEWEELINNCTYTWTTHNGVNGRLITSNINGNSIFLPAAGYRGGTNNLDLAGSCGYYWSSSFNTNSNIELLLYFNSDLFLMGGSNRCAGFSVRPVYGDPIVSVTGVSLDKTSLSIAVGNTQTLTATVTPANATNKTVTWSSSNPSVASVSPSGVVTGISTGTAIITVTTTDDGKTATCTVTVNENPSSMAAPEAVDLGLSIKWASFNLGATKPEEYGDYYAWGETEPKDDYSWETYKWCRGSQNTLTKYCSNSGYGYNGFTDDKTFLDSEDDAAHVNLGGSWRMPTDAEWAELRENCTWTWTTQNGVNGRLVTGPNGNSIFLPAAGYRYNINLGAVDSDGRYWSSSLNTDYPCDAWYVGLFSGSVYRVSYYRYQGLSVRPVCTE